MKDIKIIHPSSVSIAIIWDIFPGIVLSEKNNSRNKGRKYIMLMQSKKKMNQSRSW